MRRTRRFLHVPFRHRTAPKPIPHEIWLHIAKFIPENSLRGLYSVNSSFFDIVMNVRYREVEFIDFDSAMLKKFNRLK